MFQKGEGVRVISEINFFQPYMLKIISTAVVVGAVTSFIGVFVVLRGLAFLGDGIAHAAITGVALSFILGIHPAIGAAGFSLLFALLVGRLSQLKVVRDDTAVGIVFSTCLALGVILFTILPKFSGELFSVLFGNLLLVRANDFQIICIVGTVIVIGVILFFKELTTLVFDEKFALRSGMKVRFIDFLLLSMLCLAISVSLKVVGLVLVSSLLVVPPVIALQIGTRLSSVFIFSAFLGATFSALGVVISFLLDTPPGATIALISGVSFLIGLLAKDIVRACFAR